MATGDSDEGDSPGGKIKEKSVDELRKSIEDCQGNYGFLIGAGTSKPAGIPTAGELIEKWQSEAYEFRAPEQDEEVWIDDQEDEIGEDQNEYGFWFEQVYTTKEQRREHLEDEVIGDSDPEFGHIVLASMMAEEPGEMYVPFTLTPNFDDLLYDAFYHFVEERPKLVNHNALASEFSLTGETPTIVKVHGDYLYQNVKNLDTETRSLQGDIEDRIVQAIGEFGLVVVGYAGKDDSIMKPLIEATRSGEGVFWCVREGDELSDDAEKLLRQPNTFKVEIEGSEELFSKFFARIDGLQTPKGDDLLDRAEERAGELSKKREEARKHAPEEDKAEFDVAKAYDEFRDYVWDGEYEKARERAEEAIEQEPDQSNISRQFAELRNGLGYLLQNEFEEFEQAQKHHERALEIDPAYPPPHKNLADIYYKEFDQSEEARKHLERGIELDPDSGTSHNNLGVLLSSEFDEFEQAREHFKRAIEIDSKKPAPHYHLAKLLSQEYGAIHKARDHFERALDIDPEYADAHYEYAEFLEEIGESDEAEEHYERAAELDSEYADDGDDGTEGSA